MTRTEKNNIVDELVGKFGENQFFYLTDSSAMTVAQVNKFRRVCFEQNIEFKVYKNALIGKALERMDDAAGGYAQTSEVLVGASAIMFCENAKLPAEVLKKFQKDGNAKPLLKAAYIDYSVFLGNDSLDDLIKLKSKEELLGEVLGLLQSPARNVISALQSGGNTIAGLIKALEERAA
jgi:large subunit ribosomal protein L10